MISASAPGKVVLWGEYAVLEGAPAAVLAVNRFAGCLLEPNPTWQFSTVGFEAPTAEYDDLPNEAPADRAAVLPWRVLQAMPAAKSMPVSLTMHSEAFFNQGIKLGLGSSAALCVVVQAAFAALGGASPDHTQAQNAHRSAQAARGSGIDIAASFFGGCLRFQMGNAQAMPDPFVNRCFIWVGEPAYTGRKLGLFTDYLNRGGRTALRVLADSSETLFDNPTTDALRAYAGALKALDNAARLGVYSPPHRAAERLAGAEGLVYKPCGAGGGDIGVAVADSAEPLLGFAAAAEALGFTVLNLETAAHGVQVDRR